MFPLAQMTMPMQPQIPMLDLTAGRVPPAPVGGAPDLGMLLAQQEMAALAGAPGFAATGPAVAPPPPAAANPSIWATLANDPALQMLLLSTGLNMMQPIQPNQSSLGHAAQAIGQGVNAAGAQKAIQRKTAVEDRQMSQTDKRIDLDQQRLGLEGRRVAEAEQTGAVQRKGLEQEIRQKEKLFPKTIKELDAKIDKLIDEGKLTAAQEGYWREKARLYPSEVNADLKRADAAMRSATKPTGVEAIFQSTARAVANRAGAEGTPEWNEAFNKAKQELGENYFQKSGTSSATVQALEKYKAEWKAANPMQQGETEEQYNQRLGAAAEVFLAQKKRGNYNEALAKYLGDNALLIRTPEDEKRYKALFDSAWQAQEPKEKPAVGAPGDKPDANRKMRDTVTSAELDATAKKYGKTREQILEALKKVNPKLTVKD